MSDAERERCPRCKDGLLYATTAEGAGLHVSCFHCGYHESRPAAVSGSSVVTGYARGAIEGDG